MEDVEPKGNSTDQGKIPTPHLARQSLEGQSIEFNSRHLLSKANRIWALASCEVTSKAKNGDAVQMTTWMIDILRNTVYKNQAHHLLDKHLLKKRWPFHLRLIKCLLDQIAVLIHTLLWIQKLHWVYSDADAGRNSPPLQPQEVAERFKKQILSELPVMPCPSNAERHHVHQPCVRLQQNWAVQNVVINSPCLHLEGFHSPQKDCFACTFTITFKLKLKSGCCQKRWACPTTTIPFLLLAPALLQFGNGVLGGQPAYLPAWKLTLLKKPNQTSFQEDERARLLLWHKSAEMHDLG